MPASALGGARAERSARLTQVVATEQNLRPQPAQKWNAGCVECTKKKKKKAPSTALLFAPALNFLLGCQIYHRQLCNRRSFIQTDAEHQTCTIHIRDKSRGGWWGMAGRGVGGGGVSTCSHAGRVVSAFWATVALASSSCLKQTWLSSINSLYGSVCTDWLNRLWSLPYISWELPSPAL